MSDFEIIGMLRFLGYLLLFIGACMYWIDNKKLGRFFFSVFILLLVVEGVLIGDLLTYLFGLLLLISLPLILSPVVFITQLSLLKIVEKKHGDSGLNIKIKLLDGYRIF